MDRLTNAAAAGLLTVVWVGVSGCAGAQRGEAANPRPVEQARGFFMSDLAPLATDRASTGGVSLIDYDGDGDADLYVTNGYDVSAAEPTPQANVFYENDAGRFERREVAGLSDLAGFSSGSSWADFDNDGLLDVFVANQRDQHNVMLRRIADSAGPRFERVAEGPFISDAGWSYSAAAADVDNDGLVDVYVSNGGLSHTGPNFFYRNRGGMRFEAIAGQAVVTDDQASGGASFADFDNDGDQDLVVANRSSVDRELYKLALYRNDGKFHFTRLDEKALPGDALMPMAVAWGDVDGDGDLDLYACNLVGLANALYLNDGNGRFANGDGGRATTDGGYSYAATFGDLDNDGDLDLVVANWGAASEIYLNDGTGRFAQIADHAFARGVHHGSSVALADTDLDGDLDILIGNWPNTPGVGREENVLFENRYARGNWLRITLQGTQSNRAAIGARVTLRHADAERTHTQIREINTQSGWRSQSELAVHFGLGAATRFEEITVRWPSGIVQHIGSGAANRTVTLREP